MNKQKESLLPDTFAKNIQEQVLAFIMSGQSFSLIGMPSVGISPFLRFIENKIDAYTILLDTYELAEFSKRAFLDVVFYKISGIKKENVSFEEYKVALHTITKLHNRVVIIINKIDLLSHEFSESFLGNFRTLCYENEGKVSLIFSVNKPFIEYNPAAVVGSNMHIFSRYVYFTPYSHEDLKALLKIHSPEVIHKENILDALILSGGHIQLLQLILRSSTPNNLNHDPYIKLLLKDILSCLTRPQVRIIERIAQEKTVDMDNFLLQIGVVKRDKETYQLFSPLLKEYICKKKSFHLSVKEQLLFQFLKKNNGKIMSKEKIIEIVWKNITTGSTDWALDSLVYRLRNHPYIKEKGYEIINHKKLGYQLVKE